MTQDVINYLLAKTKIKYKVVLCNSLGIFESPVEAEAMRKIFLIICAVFSFIEAAKLGFKNNGNTCFINSALQVLYGTEYIRTTLLLPEVSEALMTLMEKNREQQKIDAGKMVELEEKIKEIQTDIKKVKQKLKMELNFEEKIKELVSKGMEEHEAVRTGEIRKLQELIDEGPEVKEYEEQLKPLSAAKSAIKSRKLEENWIELIADLVNIFHAKRMIENGDNYPVDSLENALLGFAKTWHSVAQTQMSSQGDSGEVVQQIFEILAELDFGLFKEISGHTMIPFIQGDKKIAKHVIHASLADLGNKLLTLDEVIKSGADTFGGEYEAFNDILAIRINRLKNNNAGFEKLQTPVDIPKVYEYNGETFHLYGFISHFGTDNSGHIISFVKDMTQERGVWNVYNDQHVYQNLSEVKIFGEPDVKSTVTSLFYVREEALKTIFPSAVEWFLFCTDEEYLEKFIAELDDSNSLKALIRLRITLGFSFGGEGENREKQIGFPFESLQIKNLDDAYLPLCLPTIDTHENTENNENDLNQASQSFSIYYYNDLVPDVNGYSPLSSPKRGNDALNTEEENQLNLKKQKVMEDNVFDDVFNINIDEFQDLECVDDLFRLKK